MVHTTSKICTLIHHSFLTALIMWCELHDCRDFRLDERHRDVHFVLPDSFVHVLLWCDLSNFHDIFRKLWHRIESASMTISSTSQGTGNVDRIQDVFQKTCSCWHIAVAFKMHSRKRSGPPSDRPPPFPWDVVQVRHRRLSPQRFVLLLLQTSCQRCGDSQL